jgi:hypothetical protein
MSKTTTPSNAITTAPAVRAPVSAPEAPAPQPRREKPPKALWKRVLEPVASLRLTVVLFALSLFLVFAGTLAQAETGNVTTINQYFRSYGFVWVPWQVLVHFGQVFFFVSDKAYIAGAFPFPSGWLLGVLLMTNLLAAHAIRFRFCFKDVFVLPTFVLGLALLILSELNHSSLFQYGSMLAITAAVVGLIAVHTRRSGVLILHLGLIVMMLSEWVTGTFAVEGFMSLAQGEAANFVDDHHEVELAVIDHSDPKNDNVVVIPGSFLRKGEPIRNALLPFDVVVNKYMVNSDVRKVRPGEANPATAGEGLKLIAEELPEVSGADTEQRRDIPSAYVSFRDRDTGKTINTYLLSLLFYSNFVQRQLPDVPQQVSVGGKEYEVMLRSKRTYRPFSIQLLEFRHDRFLGVNVPRNFSSKVRLVDARPDQREDREVKIWMNHPLRYAGETFYQQSFFRDDSGTILQVVRNPGWLMPYIACIMVGLGMMIHFGIHLTEFLRRRAAL